MANSPGERAVLGYFSTNCGSCHNAASTPASLGLTFRQPAYGGGRGIVSAGLARRTKWDRPGAVPGNDHGRRPRDTGARRVAFRMRSRRATSQMPPLGTVLPDHDALALVTRWVSEVR